MNRLTELLSTMDIPSSRRDTASDTNLRWLLRNIHINNGENPHLGEAINLLKAEVSPMIGE
jgi:hypothetical protein